MKEELERTALCCICYEKMFYSNQEGHEEEVSINDRKGNELYAHKRCLDNAYYMIFRNSILERVVPAMLNVIKSSNSNHSIIKQIETLMGIK